MDLKEAQRLRFWALKAAVDAADEAVTAKRAVYEPEWAEAQARRQAHVEEIRAIEADVFDGKSMFDAKQELAFLARGLGNQVGERPAD